jgi:hypothetical protein
MENLRFALRLRRGRGPQSEQQVAAVTAALDTPAVTIEQT